MPRRITPFSIEIAATLLIAACTNARFQDYCQTNCTKLSSFDGPVTSIVVDAGPPLTLYVAGNFKTYGGQYVGQITRLDSGLGAQPWASPATFASGSGALHLALGNDAATPLLYVGGDFADYNGDTSKKSLVALKRTGELYRSYTVSSSALSIAPETSGGVFALAVNGGSNTILYGFDSTGAGLTSPYPLPLNSPSQQVVNIASTPTEIAFVGRGSVGPLIMDILQPASPKVSLSNLPSTVSLDHVAPTSSALYVTGVDTAASPQTKLYRLDATNGNLVSLADLTAQATALITDVSGNVYVGTTDGEVLKFGPSLGSAQRSGRFDGDVNALAADSSYLYVGGGFGSYNQQNIPSDFARLDLNDLHYVPSGSR